MTCSCAFREELFAGSGVAPTFPLWGRDTAALAHDMLRTGIRAVVVAVDLARLPEGLVGRRFDDTFLRELPAGVDPCGENGEFHTFVEDARGFAAPVPLFTQRDRHHGSSG